MSGNGVADNGFEPGVAISIIPEVRLVNFAESVELYRIIENPHLKQLPSLLAKKKVGMR